ncbi:hypothetical protein P792_03355 [Asaia sp. SF2.1]|nr:hypothetical protein P792_03355 [Asaia sp. SF2.1]
MNGTMPHDGLPSNTDVTAFDRGDPGACSVSGSGRQLAIQRACMKFEVGSIFWALVRGCAGTYREDPQLHPRNLWVSRLSSLCLGTPLITMGHARPDRAITAIGEPETRPLATECAIMRPAGICFQRPAWSIPAFGRCIAIKEGMLRLRHYRGPSPFPPA